MTKFQYAKNRVGKALTGWVFGVLAVMMGLASLAAPLLSNNVAYAEEGETTEVAEWGESEEASEGAEETEETEATEEEAGTTVSNGMCKDSLGSLGWLVCPATGKIAEAVDWLYGRLKGILELNPVEARDGSPIYEVWKYLQRIANVVFVIFLLIVVYSQLTGVGISNYGIKKALPKLIVVAILVNLSFVMCSVLVDLSNIIGNSLRGVFETIETTALATTDLTGGDEYLMMSQMYGSMAGGAALAVGAGVIAFETGAIWMLIPVALGALVSVVVGLITIALRQAVVVLLIMVAPLAIVAHMLPNTEQWFKKWWKLLTRMLVFYPMFSLLFGASSLAGYAIIASAESGFGLILGVAVQIFPLFFAWSLMKMSGTFLETINTRLRGMGGRPVSGIRSWADERRNATRMRYLAKENAYMPSLRLRQYLSDRKVKRAEEMETDSALVKARGQAYAAQMHYMKGDLNGKLSRDGRDDYEKQARKMEYEQQVTRDKNNFEKGFGYRWQQGTIARAKIDALDVRNVKAADALKWEQARTEKIAYDNAVGFHKRAEAAINAHMDAQNGYLYEMDENGNSRLVGVKDNYKLHMAPGSAAQVEAAARYNVMSGIMEGSVVDTQYAAATAAANYDTQAQIIMKKFQKYFELTPPTKDVEWRMKELTQYQKALEQWQQNHGNLSGLTADNRLRAVDNIDAIVSGLREINRRGDTDIVKDLLDDLMDEKYGGIELGTHASQALASFLMFDVKDNDPALRRFGKYINLETARMYNKNDRKEARVNFEEYVKGYHKEPDEKIMHAKRGMEVLLEGTSFDNIERTAMANMRDMILKAYAKDGEDVTEDGLKALGKMYKASAPQLMSASLKYLSGSEGLKSMVEFITGYRQKKDASGNDYWEAIWDDTNLKMTAEERKAMREFYLDQTEKYLGGQTTSQLLKLRSDYKDPMMKILGQGWMEFLRDDHSDNKKMKEKADKARDEYSDLLAQYDDMVARAKDKDGNQLMLDDKDVKDKAPGEYANEIVRRRVREVLGDDTERRILVSANHSSAANETKSFARDWFGIDDMDLYERLGVPKPKTENNGKKKPGAEREQTTGNNPQGAGATGSGSTLYGNMRDWLDLQRNSGKTYTADEYYEASTEQLRNNALDVVAQRYKDFYETEVANGVALSVSTLEGTLRGLLAEDEENEIERQQREADEAGQD